MNERIPKIKKTQFKNNLQSVDVNNPDVQNLLREINKTCLNTEFRNEWEAVGISMVHNAELEGKYIKKRSELKDEGRTAASLQDQLGFLVVNPSCKRSIITNGLKTTKQIYNRLGKGECGVYINRYFDIELISCWKQEDVSKEIFVFKYFFGKRKAITVNNLTATGSSLEPTPNYDCHTSSVHPKKEDAVFRQHALSSIYLYEYTDACVPAMYPRQCRPAAVIQCKKRIVVPKSNPQVLPKESQSGSTKNPPPKSITEPTESRDKSRIPQTAKQNSPLIDSDMSSSSQACQKPAQSCSDVNQNTAVVDKTKSSNSVRIPNPSSLSHCNKSGLLTENTTAKKIDKRSAGSMDNFLQQTPQYLERLNEAYAKLQNEKHDRNMSVIGSILPNVLAIPISQDEDSTQLPSVIINNSKCLQGSSSDIRDPRLNKITTKAPDKMVGCTTVEKALSNTPTSPRPKKLASGVKKMSYSEYMKLKSVEKEKKKDVTGDKLQSEPSHSSICGGENKAASQNVRMPMKIDANHSPAYLGSSPQHTPNSMCSDYLSKFQSPQARPESKTDFFSQFQSPIPPQVPTSQNLFQSLLTSNPISPETSVHRGDPRSLNSSHSPKPRPRVEKKAFLPFPVLCDDGSIKNVFRGTIDGSVKEMPSNSSFPERKGEMENTRQVRDGESLPQNVKEGANELYKAFQNVFADGKKKKLIERQLSNGRKDDSTSMDQSIARKDLATKQRMSDASSQDSDGKSIQTSKSTITCPKDIHGHQRGKENLADDKQIKKIVPLDMDDVNIVAGLRVCSSEGIQNDAKTSCEDDRLFETNKYDADNQNDDSRNKKASMKKCDFSKVHPRNTTEHVDEAIFDVRKEGKSQIESDIKNNKSSSTKDNVKSNRKRVVNKEIASTKCPEVKTDVKSQKSSVRKQTDKSNLKTGDRQSVEIGSSANDKRHVTTNISNKDKECEWQRASDVKKNSKIDKKTNDHTVQTAVECISYDENSDNNLSGTEDNLLIQEDGLQNPLPQSDIDSYPKFVCRSPNADIPGINFSLDLSAETLSSKSYCSPLRLIPSLCSDDTNDMGSSSKDHELNTNKDCSETPLKETVTLAAKLPSERILEMPQNDSAHEHSLQLCESIEKQHTPEVEFASVEVLSDIPQLVSSLAKKLSSFSSSLKISGQLSTQDKDQKIKDSCEYQNTNSKNVDQSSVPMVHKSVCDSPHPSTPSYSIPSKSASSNCDNAGVDLPPCLVSNLRHEINSRSCSVNEEKVVTGLSSSSKGSNDVVKSASVSSSSSSSCLIIDETCGSISPVIDQSDRAIEVSGTKAITFSALSDGWTDHNEDNDFEEEEDTPSQPMSLKDLGFGFYLQVLSDMNYQPSVMVVDFKEAIDKGYHHSTCKTCKKDLSTDTVTRYLNDICKEPSIDDAGSSVQESGTITSGNDYTKPECLQGGCFSESSQSLVPSIVTDEKGNALIPTTSCKRENQTEWKKQYHHKDSDDDCHGTRSPNVKCFIPHRIESLKSSNANEKQVKLTAHRKITSSPQKDSLESYNSYKARLMKRQRERNQLRKIKEKLSNKGIVGPVKRKLSDHESKVDSSNIEDDDELRDTLLDDMLTSSTGSMNALQAKVKAPHEIDTKESNCQTRDDGMHIEQVKANSAEIDAKTPSLDLYDVLDKGHVELDSCRLSTKSENKMFNISMIPRSAQKFLKKKEVRVTKKEVNSNSQITCVNSQICESVSNENKTMDGKCVSKISDETVMKKRDMSHSNEDDVTSANKYQSENKAVTKWKPITEPGKGYESDSHPQLSIDIHIKAINLTLAPICKSETKTQTHLGSEKSISPKENFAMHVTSGVCDKPLENLPSIITCIGREQESVLKDSSMSVMEKEHKDVKDSTNLEKEHNTDLSIPKDVKDPNFSQYGDGNGKEETCLKETKGIPFAEACETKTDVKNMVIHTNKSQTKDEVLVNSSLGKVDTSKASSNEESVASNSNTPVLKQSQGAQGLTSPDFSLYLNQPLGDVDYRIGYHFGQQNKTVPTPFSNFSGCVGAGKTDDNGDVDYRTHMTPVSFSNSNENFWQADNSNKRLDLNTTSTSTEQQYYQREKLSPVVNLQGSRSFHSDIDHEEDRNKNITHHMPQKVLSGNGISDNEIGCERKLLIWPSFEYSETDSYKYKQTELKPVNSNDDLKRSTTKVSENFGGHFSSASENVAHSIKKEEACVKDDVNVQSVFNDCNNDLKIETHGTEQHDNTDQQPMEPVRDEKVSLPSFSDAYKSQEVCTKMQCQPSSSTTNNQSEFWIKPKVECCDSVDIMVQKFQNDSISQSLVPEKYDTVKEVDDVHVTLSVHDSAQESGNSHESTEEDSNNAVENIRKCFPDILGTRRTVLSEIADTYTYSEDEESDEEKEEEKQTMSVVDITNQNKGWKQNSFDNKNLFSPDRIAMLKRAVHSVTQCLPSPTIPPKSEVLDKVYESQNIDLSQDHVSMLKRAINTVAQIMPTEQSVTDVESKKEIGTDDVTLTQNQLSMLKRAVNTFKHSTPINKELEEKIPHDIDDTKDGNREQIEKQTQVKTNSAERDATHSFDLFDLLDKDRVDLESCKQSTNPENKIFDILMIPRSAQKLLKKEKAQVGDLEKSTIGTTNSSCIETHKTNLNDSSSQVLHDFVNHFSERLEVNVMKPNVSHHENKVINIKKPKECLSAQNLSKGRFSDCTVNVMEDKERVEKSPSSDMDDGSEQKKILLSDVPLEALTQAKLHVLEQLKSLNEDDDLDDDDDDTIAEGKGDLLNEREDEIFSETEIAVRREKKEDDFESGEVSSEDEDTNSYLVIGKNQSKLDPESPYVPSKSMSYANFVESKFEIVNISSDSEVEELELPNKKNSMEGEDARKVIHDTTRHEMSSSPRPHSPCSRKIKNGEYIEIISSQSDNSSVSSPVISRRFSSPNENSLIPSSKTRCENDSRLASNPKQSSDAECSKIKFQDLKICLDNTSDNRNRMVNSKSNRRVMVTSSPGDIDFKTESRNMSESELIIQSISKLLKEAQDDNDPDKHLKESRNSSPETQNDKKKHAVSVGDNNIDQLSRDVSPEMWKRVSLKVREELTSPLQDVSEKRGKHLINIRNELQNRLPVMDFGDKTDNPPKFLDTEMPGRRLVKGSSKDFFRNMSPEACWTSEIKGKEKHAVVSQHADKFCQLSPEVWKEKRATERDEYSYYRYHNMSPKVSKNRTMDSDEHSTNERYGDTSSEVWRNRRNEKRDEFPVNERYHNSSSEEFWNRRRDERDELPFSARYRNLSHEVSRNTGNGKTNEFSNDRYRNLSPEVLRDKRCEERDQPAFNDRYYSSSEVWRESEKDEWDNSRFKMKAKSPEAWSSDPKEKYSGRSKIGSPFSSSASESSQFEYLSSPYKRRKIMSIEDHRKGRKVFVGQRDSSTDRTETQDRQKCVQVKGHLSSSSSSSNRSRIDARDYSECSPFSESDSLCSSREISHSPTAKYSLSNTSVSQTRSSNIPLESSLHRSKKHVKSFQPSDLVDYFSPNDDHSDKMNRNSSLKRFRDERNHNYPRTSTERQHPLDELMKPLQKRKLPDGEEELDYYINRKSFYHGRRSHYTSRRY